MSNTSGVTLRSLLEVETGPLIQQNPATSLGLSHTCKGKKQIKPANSNNPV